jgi:hypothetical protein
MLADRCVVKQKKKEIIIYYEDDEIALPRLRPLMRVGGWGSFLSLLALRRLVLLVIFVLCLNESRRQVLID